MAHTGWDWQYGDGDAYDQFNDEEACYQHYKDFSLGSLKKQQRKLLAFRDKMRQFVDRGGQTGVGVCVCVNGGWV